MNSQQVSTKMIIDFLFYVSLQIFLFLQVENDPFFSIDEDLGEIRTRTALDFETQNVHYLTVIAKDKGETNQLSSSSTFTVFVQDTPDEVPTFPTRLYTATIPENTENAYVTTVQVSLVIKKYRIVKYFELSKCNYFRFNYVLSLVGRGLRFRKEHNISTYCRRC